MHEVSTTCPSSTLTNVASIVSATAKTAFPSFDESKEVFPDYFDSSLSCFHFYPPQLQAFHREQGLFDLLAYRDSVAFS